MAKQRIVLFDSSNEVERVAIDSCGKIGSFYDAYRDRVLVGSNIICESNTKYLTEKCRYSIKNCSNESGENVMKAMTIDEELRLSILLNLMGKTEKLFDIEPCCEFNEYTRYFIFDCSYKEEELKINDDKAEILHRPEAEYYNCTHIITKIQFGINIFAILQLPPDKSISSSINQLLKDIRLSFVNGNKNSHLHAPISSREHILQQIVYTKIYSNIPNSTFSTIESVLSYLRQYDLSNMGYPRMYTLRRVKAIYSAANQMPIRFTQLPQQLNSDTQEYLIYVSTKLNKAKTLIDEVPTQLKCDKLEKRMRFYKQELLRAQSEYQKDFELTAKIVVDIRRQRINPPTTNRFLDSDHQVKMIADILDLIDYVKELKAKNNLIMNLRQQNINYLNVVDYQFNAQDIDKDIMHKLIKDCQYDRILCTSDCLNNQNPNEFENLKSVLLKEREKNHKIHLIYVDFSYSTYKLHRMMILPKQEYSTQSPTLGNLQNTTSLNRKSHFNTSINDTINIILLGETGVGKSTFINAFANYLAFNSLKQAKLGKPEVLIPVSFTIAVGDNFEEKTVKFGDIDSSNNENFDNPGQSVTQRCRTYTFDIDNNFKKRICITDTPGFGDTRGLNQDEANIEAILDYIKTITHLNAICFLLKPNESRLSIYLRLCFTRLFSCLDRRLVQNVIFCFTNCRSTFYSPGDTGPLLRQALRSSSIDGIPYTKENTFVFDNESFRYLVAIQNKVSFGKEADEEYESSWNKSVNETNRLIAYVNKISTFVST